MTDEERRPAAAAPPTREEGPPDSLSALVPKRRLWPVFAVLGLVVAVVGFFVYRAVTATDPLRILIAIDLDGYWWEGSEPAAKLADALATPLGRLGFDVVKGGDPKVTKVLEREKDPDRAAKKLGAGFVVKARLAPEVVEHPVKGGYFEIRVDAPLTLTYLDKGTSSETRIRGYAYSTKKDEAMTILASSMATQALDRVVGQLLDHPAIVEIIQGSDVKLLERINSARLFAKDRAKYLGQTTDAYARVAQEHEAEGKGRVTYHSHPAAEDELVGVAPGGYFVKTSDSTPYYSFQTRDVERSEELETVGFRSIDAKPAIAAEAPTLWKGYHVFTYPSADREGDRVVLVEDLFGWAKTITMADRTGLAKRVRVDPEHRFVDPKLAPGGRFVAVYDRPHPGDPANLLVLETQGGKELYAVSPDDQSSGGFTWIDATRLVFASAPDTRAGDAHLVVVDVGREPISIERPFRVKQGQEIFMPSASRDGKQLVWALTIEAPGVAVIDTTTWTQRIFHVEGGARWPTFSPDAGHVVFETAGGGRSDIGVVALASGAFKKIVESPTTERLPLFSWDGKRVLFEVTYLAPVYNQGHHISRIASVAFEP